MRYVAVCFATLVVAGLAPQASASDIVPRYREIVTDLKQQLAKPGGTPKTINAASRLATEKLNKLINDVSYVPLTSLSIDELAALGEACERVKRYDEAVKYSEHAIELSDDDHIYKSLVRCYCQLGCMVDAERIAARAVERMPNATENYVLHNIIALKYSGQNNYSKSFDSFASTTRLLLPQVHKRAFYANHFLQCLKWLETAAEKSNRQTDHSKVLAALLADAKLQLSSMPADVEPRSLQRAALVAIGTRYDTDDAEVVCCEWLHELSGFEHLSKDSLSGWCISLRRCIACCLESLEVGKSTPIKSSALIRLRSKIESGGVPTDQNLAAAIRELQNAIAVVSQHNRLQTLPGATLFSREELATLRSDPATGDIIIYLFDPLDRSAAAGIKVLSRAAQSSPDMKNSLILAVPQSGLRWDGRLRRFSRDPDQTIEEEQSAVAAFSRIVQSRSKIAVFARDSQALKQLPTVTAPLTLRVDKDGVLVSVMAGTHKRAINQVVR